MKIQTAQKWTKLTILCLGVAVITACGNTSKDTISEATSKPNLAAIQLNPQPISNLPRITILNATYSSTNDSISLEMSFAKNANFYPEYKLAITNKNSSDAIAKTLIKPRVSTNNTIVYTISPLTFNWSPRKSSTQLQLQLLSSANVPIAFTANSESSPEINKLLTVSSTGEISIKLSYFIEAKTIEQKLIKDLIKQYIPKKNASLVAKINIIFITNKIPAGSFESVYYTYSNKKYDLNNLESVKSLLAAL